MKYSIVVPCFNEEDNIEKLYLRIKDVMKPIGDFELLFVNDGSTDNTLDRIKTIRLKDRRVKYISFLTNYGHQKALFAGLHLCHNKCVISMDADLQHPPELITELINHQKKAKVQIVAGRRKGKQKGFLKNLFSETFYRIFSWSTGLHLHPGLSDFRLYAPDAVEILCSIKEQNPFLRGMISKLRLKVKEVEYELHQRESGDPSYTFKKSLKMAINGILRFSYLPAKAGMVLGGVGILISLAQAFHYLYLRLFTEKLVPGQADLMVFLSLISSFILLQLSLLLKINIQNMDVQSNRPPYIIEEKDISD